MKTNFGITDNELRECYKLLTKEQLIEALIRKHNECLKYPIVANISSKNYGDDDIGLTSEQIDELI